MNGKQNTKKILDDIAAFKDIMEEFRLYIEIKSKVLMTWKNIITFYQAGGTDTGLSGYFFVFLFFIIFLLECRSPQNIYNKIIYIMS